MEIGLAGCDFVQTIALDFRGCARHREKVIHHDDVIDAERCRDVTPVDRPAAMEEVHTPVAHDAGETEGCTSKLRMRAREERLHRSVECREVCAGPFPDRG
jgi:hypothetical protein